MRRSIISNVTGNVMGFILSLIAIPIQIRLLGAEAYGLIGFIASLQVILVVFDFGLSSSVVREIAADSEEGISRLIAQTGAAVYWIVAIITGVLVFLSAPWISEHWLNARTLTPEYLTTAVRVIALYMVLTWPVGHYANILFARKRLDLVNILRITVAFLSQVGGIAVILLTHDLIAFLVWLTISALVSVVLHLICVKRVFSVMSWIPALSRRAIRRIWRTSFDMNIVSTASIVYTQLDKLLISSLLPLSFLGYYNIAYRLMVGSTMIPTSIAATTLPALTEQYASGQHNQLIKTYNRISQLIIYIMAGFTFALVFWGQDALQLWTSAETAANAYRVLGLLTFGSLLNTVTIIGYYVLIAAGRSHILSIIYGVGVIPYAVILYVLITQFGITGAALALTLYSIYFIFTLLIYVHRHVTHENILHWINRSFTVFLILGLAVFGAGRALVDLSPDASLLWIWTVGISCGLLYFAVGLLLLEESSRTAILALPLSLKNKFSKRGV